MTCIPPKYCTEICNQKKKIFFKIHWSSNLHRLEIWKDEYGISNNVTTYYEMLECPYNNAMTTSNTGSAAVKVSVIH